jgi:hypothetical protein
MNSSAPQEIEFRPVEASDFPTFNAWLAEPHSADSTRRRPSRCRKSPWSTDLSSCEEPAI